MSEKKSQDQNNITSSKAELNLPRIDLIVLIEIFSKILIHISLRNKKTLKPKS